MMIDEQILNPDEAIALRLRSLYRQNGYRQFRMSKFEEYDLYMKNKDFLISDGIITFNDTNGRLLALKPDVTLSIVKNGRDIPGQVEKLYYDENVYRISGTTHCFKEIMQTGLECVGDTDEQDTAQVVRLALESAEIIREDSRFQFTHVGFVKAYLSALGIDAETDSQLCRAFFGKNADALRELCTEAQFAALEPLMGSYPDPTAAALTLEAYCSSAAAAALAEFGGLWQRVFPEGSSGRCAVDFTMSNTTGYYSGIAFRAYVSGISDPVLSGGQYDGLMKKLGRSSRAIGFAVYLDTLENLGSEAENDDWIHVALPKGRLGKQVYDMFERAGYDCPAIHENNRKLIFENPEKRIRYFWVKPSDVAIYVERGAADIGVAGRDILLEYEPDVYELCDLNLGKCRMAVAARRDFQDAPSRTLRVATKFPNIAQRFYGEKCRQIDIIRLNGSIELAPILGLSDVIVDIVETGKTLLENELTEVEEILPISARLIANKSAYQFKKSALNRLREKIQDQVKRV